MSDLVGSDISIYRCNATGYRYYYPFSLAGGSEFYEKLSALRPYYNAKRWEHDRALDILSRNSVQAVFEFGCGPGHFLKRTKAKQKIGLDFNASAIRELELDDHINLVSFEGLGNDPPQHSIDAVCMFQVLEHIPLVNQLLEKLLPLLKPGGLMIIGVPNNNPYLYKHDIYHALNLPPHHMGLWDQESLRTAMEMHGLVEDSIVAEPLRDYEYWLRVNLRHHFGRRVGDGILNILYKRGRSVFNPLIAQRKGRNLLGIFRKPVNG